MSCARCEFRHVCQRIIREGGNPILIFTLKNCHKGRKLIKKWELLKKGEEIIALNYRIRTPPTWGQEIEVYKRFIDFDFRRFTEKYMGGDWDGSDSLPLVGSGEHALGNSA